MSATLGERPVLPIGWLHEDDAIDVVARRRQDVWVAEVRGFDVQAKGASKKDAVDNALEALHDELAEAASAGRGFDDVKSHMDLRRVLGWLIVLVFAASLRRDYDYFRLPASRLEEIDAERETEAVLGDPELMRQLAESADDVAAGRTFPLDELARDRGSIG